MIQQLVQAEEWILDGNFGSTMNERMAAADTIIYLDIPRYVCMYRIFKRRVMYHRKARPDMALGCPEKLDWPFVKWVWRYPKKNRPETLAKLDHLREHKQVIILQTQKQVQGFLEKLCKNKEAIEKESETGNKFFLATHFFTSIFYGIREKLC